MHDLLRLLPVLLAFGPAPALMAQQDSCENLTITSLSYAAFTDGAVEVDVTNTGPSFFSGPVFILVNADGDTIAREIQNFFGIGIGSQKHQVAIEPGFTLPPTPFTGTLVLTYFSIDGDTTCVFPQDNVALCPPEPCGDLSPYVYNTGNFVTADFNWSITDADNITVGTGQFHLDAGGDQQDLDTLCLPPGDYTLHLQQPVQIEGNYTFGLTRNIFTTNGPSDYFIEGTTGHVPFTFFGPCIEGTNAITEPAADHFLLNVANGTLLIASANDAPIGAIDVLDLEGRVIARTRTSGSTAVIDLQRRASGIYFVRSLDQRFAQRFFWHNDL